MTESAMATYQFSNDELKQIQILLQQARNVSESSYIITEVANAHINTINAILAARNTR